MKAKLTAIAVAALLVGSAHAATLNVTRVNELLLSSCREAMTIARSPAAIEQIALLESDSASRDALREVLDRFTARMVRLYRREGAASADEWIGRCRSADPGIRVDILMFDDPIYHRGPGRAPQQASAAD